MKNMRGPLQTAVPVDDTFGEMMNWAVRYSLGRMTYAPGDTCEYILPLVPYLSNTTLWCLESDLESCHNFGFESDERRWKHLLRRVKIELEGRGDT